MPKIESNWKRYVTYATAISISLAILYGVAEAGSKLDARYMKVADYQKIEQTKQIQSLEDIIFQLRMKINDNTATSVDKAMLERYVERLRGIR